MITVLTPGLERIIANLRRAPSAARAATIIAMQRSVLILERDYTRVSLSGKKTTSPLFGLIGADREALASWGGAIKRVRSTVVTSTDRVSGFMGTPDRYIGMHESATPITISGKPWLRIPTRYAKTAGGIDRMKGRSARAWPGRTKVFKSARGSLFVWSLDAARIVPLYLLVRSVTIQPRRPLHRTWGRQRPAVAAEFAYAGGRLIDAIGGKN